MGIKFNNKFAHATFEAEAAELNAPVHVLTFQDSVVLDILHEKSVYTADYEKATRVFNRPLYEEIEKELGYLPVWCFNPLQFGDDVSAVWKDEWFKGGGLWQRFMELGSYDKSCIHDKLLMEFRVQSTELKKDVVYDYGCMSILSGLELTQLVGTYVLKYPSEDDPNWYYPRIIPSVDNTELASFKEMKQYVK